MEKKLAPVNNYDTSRKDLSYEQFTHIESGDEATRYDVVVRGVDDPATYMVPGNIDLIVRIREDETQPGSFDLMADWTHNVIEPIRDLLFRTTVLTHIVRNQWKSHKYSQEYTQLLLGAHTQEEFSVIAREYALPFDKIEMLADAAAVVFETIHEDLSSGDLSQLLNVDPADIEDALSSYPLIDVDSGNEE